MFKSLVHLLYLVPVLITDLFALYQGVGDLTKVNIPTGDGGGELDPHGADGNGMTGCYLTPASSVVKMLIR